MLDATLSLFTGIVIAVVSSLVTVRLSLGRFRSERWWERKVIAYERMVAALHDHKAFFDDHLQAAINGDKPSGSKGHDLLQRVKIASDDVSKAIDMGAFLLSREALTRLRQYREDTKTKSAEDWADYLLRNSQVTAKCLRDFIVIAKKDLQIE